MVLQQVRWCAVSCPVCTAVKHAWRHVPSSECKSTAQRHAFKQASLFGMQLRRHQLAHASSREFNRAPTSACVQSSRYRAETALAIMGGVKPAVSCQYQTSIYLWDFWYCFYNFPFFSFLGIWLWSWLCTGSFPLFFLFSTLALHERKFNSIQKKNILQRSSDGSVQLFLQKGDTYSHTHQHTQYTRLDSDEHSVLPSLSHIVSTHQSTQKGNCQHLHSEEVVLEQQQESPGHWISKHLGDEVTWSVTCHWSVSCLIGACHESSLREKPWLRTHCSAHVKPGCVQNQTHIAKCLLSSLHARTPPEPATRAQDHRHHGSAIYTKISSIPGWHITMTMKQYAICRSWIKQTLNTEFAMVKPIIWSQLYLYIGFDRPRGIIIKPDNLTLVSSCNKSWCYLTK